MAEGCKVGKLRTLVILIVTVVLAAVLLEKAFVTVIVSRVLPTVTEQEGELD